MKCRKEERDIEVEHFSRCADIPAEWNELVPVGHFLQLAQCNITESISLPDVRFLYVLVRVKRKPVAAAYFQVLALQQQHINKAMVKPWQSSTWIFFVKTLRPKMLVAGHLFRHDVSSFYWTPELSDYEAYTCYMAAIDKALEVSNAMAVLVKDTPEPLVKYFQNYAPQYLPLRNDISMEMDIPGEWHVMADYEKALKHKYAQRMRKVRAELAKLNIKELDEEGVKSNKVVLFGLYQQVVARQQVRLGLLNEDFLPVLKRFHGDDLRVWLAYENEKPVGFFSAWVKEGVFDMFYIGFDYARNQELQLYFNMLFFGVEQAITNGKEKLILGRTALDAKARIGCKPRYLSTYLYIKNSFLRQRVLNLQQKTALQEGAWEDRHPFKS